MRTHIARRLTILGLATITSCFGQATSSDAGSSGQVPTLDRMPESLEIQFALSAIPPHLRDAATVYLLDPAKGYVLAHQGTNGVSCIVVRSDWQWADQPF